MYFYEIKTLDSFGFPLLYYIVTSTPLRRAANINPIPEKLRVLIDDRYESVVAVKPLNVFSYLYNKYIKRNIKRVNWEKEV